MTMMLVVAILIYIVSTIAATTLTKLTVALKNRDLNLGVECMKALEISELGTEAFVNQLCRSSVPITSTIIDVPEYLISIISLPKSSSMPLHTRPGVVMSKLLTGSLTLRQLDILLFVEDDDIKKITSFEHEDAFAGGGDCVCRGGVCPRREGCVFWVNKQMRESGASLFVSEKGYSQLSIGDVELIQETAGPRELIHLPKSKEDDSSSSAVIIQVLLRDIDQADMIEDVPSLQFYRADRLEGAGVEGNKLKVTATYEPLGLVPMYIPWRGTKISE
jgi:hypothetical protein